MHIVNNSLCLFFEMQVAVDVLFNAHVGKSEQLKKAEREHGVERVEQAESEVRAKVTRPTKLFRANAKARNDVLLCVRVSE